MSKITRKEAIANLQQYVKLVTSETNQPIKHFWCLENVSSYLTQQPTPKELEEVKCSKCNYSGNHLLKLSHQNMSDRVKYECLNCGNIEVVLTSTPQLRDSVEMKSKDNLEKIYNKLFELDSDENYKHFDSVEEANEYHDSYVEVKQHIQGQEEQLEYQDDIINSLDTKCAELTSENERLKAKLTKLRIDCDKQIETYNIDTTKANDKLDAIREVVGRYELTARMNVKIDGGKQLHTVSDELLTILTEIKNKLEKE